MGRVMTWQEPVVALIVGMAVWSFVKHLRDLLRVAAPGSEAQSCHGCDDCSDAPTSAPVASITAPAPGSGPESSTTRRSR